MIDGILERDSSLLPLKNVHLSVAKMVMDQFEIFAAEIDYGTDFLNVMETTRLLAQPDLSWSDFQASFCTIVKPFCDYKL